MDPSKKPEVIEILFKQAEARGASWIITNNDVRAAINERNKRHPDEGRGLSASNPANFMKDFIRTPSCNDNWPLSLKNVRITARQRYGNAQVFEFVPYEEGDALPFPDRYEPGAAVEVIEIESLSIPSTARALGRKDEAWLIQVVVNQHIAHTHFARFRPPDVTDFTHLQMSVKTQPEIDATFVATIDENGDTTRALVTCEAKQRGQRLLEHQIREQVQQAFKMTQDLPPTASIDAVIPIALRVMDLPVNGCDHAVRGIHFLEFAMIRRTTFEADYAGENLYQMPLTRQSDAFYVMKPPVAGVSG